jgi:hypothetical protein
LLTLDDTVGISQPPGNIQAIDIDGNTWDVNPSEE